LNQTKNSKVAGASQSPRSISVGLTEKAYATVVAEAQRRSVAPQNLMLAALLDYLGRGRMTPGAKASPLVLHIPWRVRERVIATARAQGMTPNQFMILAASKAVDTKKDEDAMAGAVADAESREGANNG